MRALMPILIALVCGSALAGGRAACRVVYTPPLWGVCYAEQVVWAWGDFEVAVGVDVRLPGPQVTPYTVLAYYAPGWWATVEAGRGLDAWRWAIGVGVRW